MTQSETKSRFEATILCPAKPGSDSPWAFVVLPKDASAKLPRRGRTTIEGSINGIDFLATLEPDGQLSHWLPLGKELLEAAGVSIGELSSFKIMSAAEEAEPGIPSDLEEALAANPDARDVWKDTSTIARIDWVHWISSARQSKTRAKRISDACDMLASGKRRVCCFDPSGYYSKAFGVPKT